MFIDWLSIYQDFDEKLPFLSETVDIQIDTATGQELAVKQPVYKEEGSYCSSIRIRLSGNRLRIEGNPSRFNRIENLFGYKTIEECVAVYNKILMRHGLPAFTKCKNIYFTASNDRNRKRVTQSSDGAVITEIHLTSNSAVGKGCTNDYIKGLSTQRYKNSIPRLHTNGKTVDWLTPKGNGGMIYPCVYDKAYEIKLHSLTKLERKYGKESQEVKYLNQVINYCKNNGVVRHELKLKSSFLRRTNLRFYGLFNQNKFKKIHKEFIDIDKKLKVTKMNIEMINERLISLGICNSMKAANTTTFYVMQWMHGKQYDLSNRNVQKHRARLRKIGIDIASACDLERFSPVYVISAKEIQVSDLPIPIWYQKPAVNHLHIAA